MKDMVIGTGRSKRVSKSSWNVELKNGPRMPKEEEMGQRSPQAV